MKKLLTLLLLIFVMEPANAEQLDELWLKYAKLNRPLPSKTEMAYPGRIFGNPGGQGEAAYDYPWKYRSSVYEQHYDKPGELARSIYSLAVHARDVNPALPKKKFYSGVLGYHYSVGQICDWLNDSYASKQKLEPAELNFVERMVNEGIIRKNASGFEPGGNIKHVLAAAPGKKRSFAQNLRHERLHVFWDEDPFFQKLSQSEWQALPSEDKRLAREKLKNYAQDNDAQLLEEWAVKRAEAQNMSLERGYKRY